MLCYKLFHAATNSRNNLTERPKRHLRTRLQQTCVSTGTVYVNKVMVNYKYMTTNVGNRIIMCSTVNYAIFKKVIFKISSYSYQKKVHSKNL